MPSPSKSTTAGLTSWPSMFCSASVPAFLKTQLPSLRADLLEEVGVGGVEQEVELAVAVPVGDAELAPAALAGGAGVQPQRLAVLVDEGAARRQQHELAVAASRARKREVAFVVEHHQIEQAVAG